MVLLAGQLLERVRDAIGKEPPPEHSVRGLDDLPSEVVKDLVVIHQRWGTLCAFAYLRHVTEASFGEVKLYLDGKGWVESVD